MSLTWKTQTSMLSWYSANASIVELTGQNRTGDLDIVFSTIKDAAGSDDITIFVVDSDGMVDSAVIHVVIEPVNDPPVIEPVDPIVVEHSVSYIFDFTHYISDPDNSLDELSLSVDDDNAPYTTVANGLFTFSHTGVVELLTKRRLS